MRTIPYGRQFVDNSDIKEVSKALKQDLITTGSYVEKFELAIKRKFKVNHSILCNSGTSALHLVFLSINLKKNDVVIMPAINFIASYNQCKILGAKIFLADVDSSTGQMTPKNVLECINKNKIKKVKLLITMYLGGYPDNVVEFFNLKKKLNCFLIEDACHAFGAKYRFKNKLLSIGSCIHSDACIFSFHPVKTITTAEGGVITTKSKRIYNLSKNFRSHGITRGKFHWDYDISNIGFNYRISDINCALGLSQFRKTEKFIKKRKSIYYKYYNAFKYINFFRLRTFLNNVSPSFHLILLQFNFPISIKQKNEILYKLKKKKIKAQYHYIPIYRFKIYSKKKEQLKGSENYYRSTISLPIHYNLSVAEQEKVINILTKISKELFKNFYEKKYS